MKIFANIPTFFKAYGNLPQLTQFKKTWNVKKNIY